MSTPTIGEFLARLDRIIPGQKAAEWDAGGLQLGDPQRQAAKVAVCHEVTEDVVAAVETDAVDLLVAYHPLLFRPTNRLTAGRSPAGRAFRLVRADVALAIVHTAFDAVDGGMADQLASWLGLTSVSGFGHMAPRSQAKIVTFVPHDVVESVAGAMGAAGAGRIGRYTGCSFRSEGIGAFVPEEGAQPVSGSVGNAAREPEIRLEMVCDEARLDQVLGALSSAHPYDEAAYDVYEVTANAGFVGRVGTPDRDSTLGALVDRIGVVPGLRTSGNPDAPAERVAVVPGSGAGFAGQARAAGADTLVTGDVSHHSVVAARDSGLSVVDIGHTTSERPGMARLVDLVSSIGVETVDLTGLDPTTWR